MPTCMRKWSWAALVVSAIFAGACPGRVSGEADSAGTGAPPATVITVPLEYQETSYQFLFRSVPVERRLAPFPKEPPQQSGPVVRGVLKFGGNPSNAIPFLWQGGAQKLFVDLNRNQDLTDDPAGVCSAQVMYSATPDYLSQMYTNIHLSFPASSAGAPMLVALHFRMDIARRPGQALCNATLRSYWQGKVTREGHDWQVGLLQNLSDQPGSFRHGQLLLRPWEERNKRFVGSCEVPEDTLAVPWNSKNWMARASDAFPFSPKVFLEGRACLLDWSAEPRGRADQLALRVTEQPTALGELRINGSFIDRLVLTGGPYVVVLAQPPARVKVPPGRYHPYRVWLKHGKGEAYFDYGVPQSGKANAVEEISGAQMPVIAPPPPEQAVVVDEQRPGVMAVGGPLTNCVSAAHRGRNLLLSYQLVGSGGRPYRLAGWGGGKPPRFAIGKSGKRIGLGQFEFG
jgi:hypothetical protein